MKNRHSKKWSLFLSAVLFSFSTYIYATENHDISNNNIIIPMIPNAQVFADFTNELPAVLNYFTSASEEQIISFYQQHYNDSVSQERKRGHLTLTYQQEQHRVRVVISQQNKKRQVDIIVEPKE